MTSFERLSAILACVVIAAIFCDAALPGREKSPTQQCRERLPYVRRAEACTIPDPTIRCAHLICAQIGRGDIAVGEDYGPALDGTWCGDNKICLEGLCINEPHPTMTSRRIVENEQSCNYGYVDDGNDDAYDDLVFNPTEAAHTEQDGALVA